MDKQGYFAHIKQRTLYNSNTQSRIPLFQKETQYFIWIGSYLQCTIQYIRREGLRSECDEWLSYLPGREL